MFAKALPAAAALLVAAPALAQQPPLLLGGLGVGVSQTPYRGVDPRTRVLPMLVYENAWRSVALPTASVKLGEFGPVALRLRTRYGFEGYEADDSPDLVGMAERKGSLWLGPAALWRSPVGDWSLSWLGDTLGHSKGSQWQLQYEKRFESGDLALTPRIALHGLDRKYVDYYYGVRANEATAARPPHAGDSTLQTELGLRLSWRLGERDSAFADLSGTRLGGAVARSPLLERRYQAGFFAGYLYRF